MNKISMPHTVKPTCWGIRLLICESFFASCMASSEFAESTLAQLEVPTFRRQRNAETPIYAWLKKDRAKVMQSKSIRLYQSTTNALLKPAHPAWCKMSGTNHNYRPLSQPQQTDGRKLDLNKLGSSPTSTSSRHLAVPLCVQCRTCAAEDLRR